MMDKLIIKIEESSNEPGYFYDIYDNEEVMENCKDSLDGGICTGSMLDALGMAVSQARYLLLQGTCDNTDHLKSGGCEDCREVVMDKEFQTDPDSENPDVAIWCKDCRERDEEFISKVLE